MQITLKYIYKFSFLKLFCLTKPSFAEIVLGLSPFKIVFQI